MICFSVMKNTLSFSDIYALLTKREVKMAGYWPSSFFEKERGQYPAILTKQAWSIKDLFYGQKVTPSISFNAPANFRL